MTEACPYCGTGLIERDGDTVEDNSGRHHAVLVCREYVFTACQAYKKDAASAHGDAAQLRVRVEQLKAELERSRGLLRDLNPKAGFAMNPTYNAIVAAAHYLNEVAGG